MTRQNFFFAYRGEEIDRLQQDDPPAFLLLSYVARKTKRYPDQYPKWCPVGWAWVPGCKAVGLTDKEYRGAKARLSKGEHLDAKGASKGTQCRLLTTRFFEVEHPDEGEQRASSRADKGRAIDREHRDLRENREEERRTGAPGGAPFEVPGWEQVREEAQRVDIDERIAYAFFSKNETTDAN